MSDKIDMNKALAYLEYDIERGKVKPEDEEVVKEGRNIR